MAQEKEFVVVVVPQAAWLTSNMAAEAGMAEVEAANRARMVMDDFDTRKNF